MTSIGMVQMLMAMDLAMMNMGSQNLAQMAKIVIGNYCKKLNLIAQQVYLHQVL